jgi:hypothetical protein
MTLGAPPEVSGSVVRGTGWTLTLAAGNTLVPDPKKAGSYVVSGPPQAPQSPQPSPAPSGRP